MIKKKLNIVSLQRNQFSQQFVALFQKDVLQIVQGSFAIYIIRIVLAVIFPIILFGLFLAGEQVQETSIEPDYHILKYKLPSCFYISGKYEKNFGSKVFSSQCISLAYYPTNKYTDQIASYLAETLNLEMDRTMLKFNDSSEYANYRYQPMFAIEFQNPIRNPENFTEFLQNLTVMIYYNSSYTDYPHYFQQYNEEKITSNLTEEMFVTINPASSFPTILQYHVSHAIMKANNITYEPVIRQLPYLPNNNSKKPKKFLSFTFILIPILVQFIFTYLHLAHEKNVGTLNSLRLSGVSDVIYHIETFIFQYGIYLIGCANQMYAIYLFPVRYDVYKFINAGMFIPTTILSGMYSTTLAMFLNIITTIRVGNAIMILFLALFLVWIIVMLMAQYTLQFDPSFMPVILQAIVVLVYPFVLVIYSFAKLVMTVKASVSLNDESLQFQVTNSLVTVSYASFFQRDEQRCMLNNRTFFEPSFIAVQTIVVVQAICLFFGAWILGEWLPINSSACRPPWKLFTPNVLQNEKNVHTYGSQKEEKENNIKRILRSKKNLRQKLSLQQIQQCFEETGSKSDITALKQAQTLLENDLQGNEVLIAHHLHKTFKRPHYNGQRMLMGKNHLAVSSVSLKLVEGEIMGIAGRSGCGKSTTFSLLSGAIKPNKPGYRIYPNDKFTKEYINNAWVGQHNIRQDMNHIRNVLGLCPQFNTNVSQDLTIHQNLIFQCKIKKIPYYDHKRIAKSLLLKIGLWEWRDKKMRHLSGGMQRRVAIAMSMVSSQTKLIILDEPSTGLDPQTKRVIWSLIKSAARDKRKTPIIVGTSMDTIMLKRMHEKLPGLIITSHDMDELDSICDSVNIMSSGQIVAAGTTIELKNKFGKGYMLSVICNSASDRQQFKLIFEQQLDVNQNPQIKLLDQSGVMLQYSIEISHEELIIACLQLIETYIKKKSLVCDYQLEKSSMDEVFINVGNIYDPSNGGNVFNTLLIQKNKNQQDAKQANECILDNNTYFTQSCNDKISEQTSQSTPVTHDHKIFTSSSKSTQSHKKQHLKKLKESLLSQEQNLLELTSDSEIDIEYNNDTQDVAKLSDAEIRNILSPPRYPPKILRSLLYKMAVNDNLNRAGVVQILLMPLILLLMSVFFAEWLIPFVMSLVTNQIEETKQSLDALCKLCQPIQALNVILPECEGYTAWGVPNVCEYSTIFNYKQYQSSPAYYGGDYRANPYITNLYSEQQHPVRLIIFDKDQKKLGANDLYYQLSSYQSGVPQIQHVSLYLTGNNRGQQYSYNIQQSSTKYKITNSIGQPVNNQMVQKLQDIINQTNVQNNSILNNFPIKPIAIQNYNITSGSALNDFKITTDMILNNGYELYESSEELDKIYIKKLLEFKNSVQIKRRVTASGNVIEYPRRNFSVLSYTDLLNFQYLQQQVAKNLPVGYIDMDKYKSPEENVYRPYISSFLPGSISYKFYRRYGSVVRVVSPSDSGTNIQLILQNAGLSASAANNILRLYVRVLMAPAPSPSILDNPMQGLITSPQTAFMDINARLSNSILRTKVNKDINIIYGVQMMKNTQINLFANMSLFAQLGMSGVLVMIAVFLSMLRFGGHVVMDRQSGLRRQLFLNGVSGQKYWTSTLLYIALANTVCVTFIMVLSRYVLQLRVIQTIDGTVFFMISVSGLVSVTSLTMFMSCFFKKQGYYIAVVLLIIIISALSLFFEMDSISVDPPFYAYFIQSIAFVKILVDAGFASYNVADFLKTQYFLLLIWTLLESGIMLLLSYYLDQVLPNLNGYKPQIQVCKRKSSKYTMEDNICSTKSYQSLLNDSISTSQVSVASTTLRSLKYESLNLTTKSTNNNNKIKVNADVSLTKVPMVPQQKTQRDVAAMHDETRMDVDIIDERKQIKNGVPLDTTVLVANLSKYYNKFVAIRDISFYLTPQERGNDIVERDGMLTNENIKSGVVFSLLGKNGACKSTLIKCMTGLEQQSSGKVYIHGYDMSDLRQAREAYKHIGLCSQFDVYLPSLTIRQHLHLFAAIHGVKWTDINNIVYKIAQFVELADVLDKRVQKLSGGMKRRLSLALALIG